MSIHLRRSTSKTERSRRERRDRSERSAEDRDSRRAVEEPAPERADRERKPLKKRRSRRPKNRKGGAASGTATAKRGGRTRRSGDDGKRRDGRAPTSRKRTDGDTSRGGRPSGTVAAPDPVSRFSAAALRSVTVLGDRPNQVVFSLAEQSRRKRGTYVLGGLLGLSAVALLALLAVLAFQVFGPQDPRSSVAGSAAAPPEGHTRLQPELVHTQPQLDLFDPIAERSESTEPMSADELFGDVEELESEGVTLTLQDSDFTDACTSVAWGEDVSDALVEGGCASAGRGLYQDESGEYVAQFTLFDLDGVESSTGLADALSPESSEPGFVVPLNSDMEGLHEGYSQATTQVMGHYLAVFWVARADGAEPADGDSMASLNVTVMDAAVSVYERVRDAE